MDPAVVERTLFHKGAEADLYLARVGPWRIVLKERVEKKYRQKELDHAIRRERTIKESTVLRDAKLAGVHTPSLISIDLEACSIGISYIPGRILRETLDSTDRNTGDKIFHEVGRQLGRLHTTGIVHGDFTTSNIIIAAGFKPFLIDFGLSHRSDEPEDRAVDIHLLRRSITTSHKTNTRSFFTSLTTGYGDIMGSKAAGQVQRKTVEIARRGRYFAIR